MENLNKKILNTFLQLLIITFIFLGVASIMNKLNCKRKPVNIIDTVKIVSYKDVFRIDTVIKPKYIPIFNHDTLLLHDTIIIKDTIIKYITSYLTKNVYIDTLLNDSSGLIVVTDTINRNKIKSRKSDISIYKTIIQQPKQTHFYIGVGSTLNNELIFSGGIERKRHLIHVGYGTNETILLNYSYKLR